MTTAEKTLFDEIVKVFPHITEEKFKESITKGGLIEASLKAMEKYADQVVKNNGESKLTL